MSSSIPLEVKLIKFSTNPWTCFKWTEFPQIAAFVQSSLGYLAEKQGQVRQCHVIGSQLGAIITIHVNDVISAICPRWHQS